MPVQVGILYESRARPPAQVGHETGTSSLPGLWAEAPASRTLCSCRRPAHGVLPLPQPSGHPEHWARRFSSYTPTQFPVWGAPDPPVV